ncbi:MAG TPA: CDP-diacylglycerol--glycerol-3-phosphate 3-phosphatidyltransferase [Gemmatimonadales bacterium]
MRWTLPNILTVSRICLTPVIALLPFFLGYRPKLAAFAIFLAAAITDTIDGWLARRYQQVSELGQFLDPIADKLLLFATLVPIYWLTNRAGGVLDYSMPWWGGLPPWVVVVLVGREVLITAFRFFAKRRGVVIPAAGPGKLKATVQAVFIGSALAWFAWRDLEASFRIDPGFRAFWEQFHGAVMGGTLAASVVLTIYSMVVYLYRYRGLLRNSGG